MPLRCFTDTRLHAAAKLDIVAVPAIGADPLSTFRYPGLPKPNPRDLRKWRHLFSEISGVRVFLYTFDRPRNPKTHGITRYADDLLDCMVEHGLGVERLIHMVGHSTGGIVVKRALVIANGSNKPEILDLKRKCCSIAFFGTPHQGSTVLSQSTYKQAISDVLGIEFLATERIRRDLRDVENIDDMGSFSKLFEPLTVNMEKIWSFYETLDTDLQVRAKAGGQTGITKIHRLVVERRSAALDGGDSNHFPHVGCQELVPIKADHATLPRFGDDPKCSAYQGYKDQLQLFVETLATVNKEGWDTRWLEHQLQVEVHRFHDLNEDNQTTVKLWSVRPTLYDLLESGPEACLNERVVDAIQPPSNPAGSATDDALAHDVANPMIRNSNTGDSNTSGSRPALQIRTNDTSNNAIVNPSNSVEHPPNTASTLVGADQDTPDFPHLQEETEGVDDDAQSDISSPSAYSLPEKSRFRWIHVPCNNPLWVDKVFLAVEKEREKRQFDEVAESTPTSADCEAMNTNCDSQNPTLTEAPQEMLERPLENPFSARLLRAKQLVEQQGHGAPDLKEAIMNPRTQIRLLKLAQNLPSRKQTNLIPEAAQLVDDTRESRIILDITKQHLKEGHAPDLSLINRKLVEDRTKAKLSSAILSEDYWMRKQMNSRHDLPHGRYMDHSCKLFLPKRSVETDTDAEDSLQHYLASIPSPIESPQLCVYLPYLHWDTFSGLQIRNKIVKNRLKHPVTMWRNPKIEEGHCLESKLIWQYLVDKNNLSLHIRRTLDQFGQAHLEDTDGRDQDQVLYKCTMPRDDDPFTGRIFHSIRNRASNADDAKVLMVDQLWCWVVDSDTVTTFFTPREDLKAHQEPSYLPDPTENAHFESFRSAHIQDHSNMQMRGRSKTYSAADLLYHLYADVNGDQRFANKCFDPFDFVALAVWHAVTVFLDRTPDRDLQVFILFEERLCELVEFRTSSFKKFRDSQIMTSSIFMGRSSASGSSKRFQEIIQALDPSFDLTALIELQDIHDELNMLGTLFINQFEVISHLIQAYELLDRSSEHASHTRAISWLRETKSFVSRQQEKVKSLCEYTKTAIEECKSLLDMKQKQSNVIEAYFGRIAAETQGAQNRSILIFTIFTVVFLPLSFFTSLFSMNVREWTGNDTNKTLHTVLTVMVSVSVFVIIAVVFMAFTRPIVGITKEATKKTVVTVKNGHRHFQRLRDWWNRNWRKEEGTSDDDTLDAEAGTITPAGTGWMGSGLDLERPEQRERRRRRNSKMLG